MNIRKIKRRNLVEFPDFVFFILNRLAGQAFLLQIFTDNE